MKTKLEYPEGAEFAFTILDDTDDTTVEKGRPVYDLLKEAGLRTTKTVWAFDNNVGNHEAYLGGETLENPEYLKWVHQLSRDGFEIAFHNASMGTSYRQDTIKALDFIEKEFGKAVQLHCNHGQNRENIYWGADRYSSYLPNKIMHALYNHYKRLNFEGHIPGSPYYWSDIATERLSYMRAFAYSRLNGMKILPGKPFKDPRKKNTPYLFNTADAGHVYAFNKMVNPRSLDRLHKQGGWAIVSTHLGKHFFRDGKLNSEFEKTIRYLSDKPGWYVPASELLDFIRMKQGVSEVNTFERAFMEYSHILDRLFKRIENLLNQRFDVFNK